MKAGLAQCIVVLVGIFLAPFVSHAQFNTMFNTGGFGTPEIIISLDPAYPQPGDTVTASINDYSSSLYGAQITWQINDETIIEATNRREMEFTAPTLGSADTITVTFTTPNGQTQTLSKTVSPVYLDIIIEPQTHVPHFYQGRAVPSIGSLVNATALVSTAAGMRTTDLIYTWRIDQKVIEGGPLRGGYKVSFTMPPGDGSVLTVQATEPNGAVVSSRAVLVRSVMPELQFYEVSALFGLKETAITESFPLSGNTATIRAVPYYLDTRIYNNPDVSEWKLNNQSAGTTGNNPYEVTLQRTGTFNSARLSFHVRDTTQVLQGAKDDITINF